MTTKEKRAKEKRAKVRQILKYHNRPIYCEAEGCYKLATTIIPFPRGEITVCNNHAVGWCTDPILKGSRGGWKGKLRSDYISKLTLKPLEDR